MPHEATIKQFSHVTIEIDEKEKLTLLCLNALLYITKPIGFK